MSVGSVDEGYLLRAIELARRSREKGNHPFGSLLVDTSGDVVLEAENTVVTGRDVTGHAELNLVRAAGMQFDVEALLPSTLYASTEPCADTAGVVEQVLRLMGIVEDVSGSSTLALSCREVFARGGRNIEVSGPNLIEQAAAVHEGFWADSLTGG